MPTYEYACGACRHRFEKFQSISASPIRKCPKCGKSKVRRLLGTGAGLIFKGSGFYITDYRSESYKSAAKGDAGASGGESGAASETKSGAEGKASDAPSGESKPAESGKSESTSSAKPRSRSKGKSSRK
jgi:putative FmdB family regulatory protein